MKSENSLRTDVWVVHILSQQAYEALIQFIDNGTKDNYSREIIFIPNSFPLGLTLLAKIDHDVCPLFLHTRCLASPKWQACPAMVTAVQVIFEASVMVALFFLIYVFSSAEALRYFLRQRVSFMVCCQVLWSLARVDHSRSMMFISCEVHGAIS